MNRKKKNKYTDADSRLNYILNESSISEPIQAINEYYQRKGNWCWLLIYVVILLVFAASTWFCIYKCRYDSDLTQLLSLIFAAIPGLILSYGHHIRKDSSIRKLSNNNYKVRSFFKTRIDSNYLAYILESRVKAKKDLDAEWWAMFKASSVISGLSGLVSGLISPKTPLVSLGEIWFAAYIMAYLLCTLPFGEYLNHATWELLAEDAQLALIEKDNKKDCSCR